MTHTVRLCLAPELRSAIVQFMAKNGLDKEYACLVLLVKQLYQEKLIEKDVYEVYLYRYSRKLVGEPVSKMMVKQLQEERILEEKSRQFSMVLNQWNLHGVEWRQKWIRIAGEWKDRVKNANLILELSVSSQVTKTETTP